MTTLPLPRVVLTHFLTAKPLSLRKASGFPDRLSLSLNSARLSLAQYPKVDASGKTNLTAQQVAKPLDCGLPTRLRGESGKAIHDTESPAIDFRWVSYCDCWKREGIAGFKQLPTYKGSFTFLSDPIRAGGQSLPAHRQNS